MNTLVVLSSILGDRSHSKELVDHLLARVAESEPQAPVVVRDLGAQPLPYFDAEVMGALFTPAESRTPAQQALAAPGDDVVAELFAADRVVLAVPVYNFSVPAQLKSYIDYIARAGVTFRYTPQGVPEGLVKNKQVIVLLARGGKAAGTPEDNVTPYLRQMLGFLGMTNVTFIAAEGLAMGEDTAREGMAVARRRIDEHLAIGAAQAA
ncbi:FMN-dependent NADH-azoreductase [Bordetella sp. 2513F-2]